MTVPLYIGEMAPPRIRGALVSLNQLAITSGILASYLVDYGLASSANWRLMFGLAVIPAVLLFVGILTQAESPHWRYIDNQRGYVVCDVDRSMGAPIKLVPTPPPHSV